MPLFKKPTAIHPTLDAANGDDQAWKLRGDLERGDWSSSHQLLERTRDWEDRQFYVDVLADWRGRPAWLDEWLQDRRDSAIPWLIRGAHGLVWAWEARGGGMAETVTEDGFNAFFERLRQAQDDLLRASRLDEADPTPWVYLLIAIRGLEEGLEAGLKCFAQLQARYRWSVYGHIQMLQLLTRKWGAGSHEEMFEFARAASAAAPVGSLVHRVTADAHAERWLYLRNWEQNRKGAEDYFRKGDVKREILNAAQRSIWAPGFSPPRRAVIDRNMFAFCFIMMCDFKAARREFDAIGPIVTLSPWAMLGDPVAVFVKWHELAN